MPETFFLLYSGDNGSTTVTHYDVLKNDEETKTDDRGEIQEQKTIRETEDKQDTRKYKLDGEKGSRSSRLIQEAAGTRWNGPWNKKWKSL